MASSTTSDEQHSFPMNLSLVNVNNFVSSKLSGDKQSNNYSSWKQQMLCLIESQDLLRFVDGTIPPPQPPLITTTTDDGKTASSKEYVMWRTERLIKGWILGALDDTVLKTVANFASARDVWLELEKNFSEPKPAVADVPPQTQEEWHNYLPLYRATLMGEWDEAKRVIDRDPNAIKARIAFTLETALHIAVGTGKAIDFVEKLVDLMHDDLLGVKDELGYTALHVASLRETQQPQEYWETLWYLISETKDDVFPSPYLGETGLKLLCTVIDADIFDVALYLAGKYTHLATLKLENGNSGLRRIALKDSAFSSGRRPLKFRERFIYLLSRANTNLLRKHIHEQALYLVRCLCKNMECLDYRRASSIYVDVMLIAARLGVHELRTVVKKVFNLIYQTSDHKHQYSDLTDSSGNTLLHLAARLAPPHKLNLVSGAALQMQREIQWFNEVEKFLHPYSRERPNNGGKTPKMVFTEEHIKLKANGERWMKDTANSCTIAAALIATVVFAAAITVPGGNKSDTGFPLFSNNSAFIIFAVSDAISLFTSTTSLLMFLSILTSLCGRGFLAWILIPVAALACLPVTSFVLLQFPLLVDVISNTYGRGIFVRMKKNNVFMRMGFMR
ncbi:hypothetical protein DH2020_039509 [Rehmannia glutinosa]|uniref:PGG domain-containing protein n=1 Tax=Rehmannia glutinosa TaxID=99300 RepID=A0ABR0UWR7_REHGL